MRNRIVWIRPHGLHATKKFSGRHETILWFVKGPDYKFYIDPIRVPQKYPDKKHFKGDKRGTLSCNPMGKNPGDVWAFRNVRHNRFCYFKGCPSIVDGQKYFCAEYWRLVPADQQAALFRAIEAEREQERRAFEPYPDEDWEGVQERAEIARRAEVVAEFASLDRVDDHVAEGFAYVAKLKWERSRVIFNTRQARKAERDRIVVDRSIAWHDFKTKRHRRVVVAKSAFSLARSVLSSAHEYAGRLHCVVNGGGLSDAASF